ncbi:hypothetical protein GHT06_014306 [Daphnia sinensis]|uniref:Uncharacterized protein n=1 Tax=Daphnia sinensis TaxID=1820382 RepID=A0AAD5LCR0_9CRUS|nr:hypothetical protein GHT06_014306 [Daphnia sinensis]
MGRNSRDFTNPYSSYFSKSIVFKKSTLLLLFISPNKRSGVKALTCRLNAVKATCVNQSASPFPSVSKMPVFLASEQLVWLFLVTSLVSLVYTATERNEAIKRSFHIEPSQSFLTVTIPAEDDITLDRMADDEMTTTESSLVAKSTKAPRQNKRVSSSLVSVLNRCLNRLLTPRFLGPFLIFAVIVSLLNGPLFGLKVLLFSIQFNIVFPTFVCFVSEFFNRNTHQARLS